MNEQIELDLEDRNSILKAAKSFDYRSEERGNSVMLANNEIIRYTHWLMDIVGYRTNPGRRSSDQFQREHIEDLQRENDRLRAEIASLKLRGALERRRNVIPIGFAERRH